MLPEAIRSLGINASKDEKMAILVVMPWFRLLPALLETLNQFGQVLVATTNAPKDEMEKLQHKFVTFNKETFVEINWILVEAALEKCCRCIIIDEFGHAATLLRNNRVHSIIALEDIACKRYREQMAVVIANKSFPKIISLASSYAKKDIDLVFGNALIPIFDAISRSERKMSLDWQGKVGVYGFNDKGESIARNFKHKCRLRSAVRVSDPSSWRLKRAFAGQNFKIITAKKDLYNCDILCLVDTLEALTDEDFNQLKSNVDIIICRNAYERFIQILKTNFLFNKKYATKTGTITTYISRRNQEKIINVICEDDIVFDNTVVYNALSTLIISCVQELTMEQKEQSYTVNLLYAVKPEFERFVSQYWLGVTHKQKMGKSPALLPSKQQSSIFAQEDTETIDIEFSEKSSKTNWHPKKITHHTTFSTQ